MNRPGKLSSVTIWWETPNKLRWIGNHRSLRRVDLKISQGKSWGDERRIPKVCGFSKIFWKFSPRFLGVSWSNFHFDLRRIVQIGLKFKKPPPIAKVESFDFLAESEKCLLGVVCLGRCGTWKWKWQLSQKERYKKDREKMHLSPWNLRLFHIELHLVYFTSDGKLVKMLSAKWNWHLEKTRMGTIRTTQGWGFAFYSLTQLLATFWHVVTPPQEDQTFCIFWEFPS